MENLVFSLNATVPIFLTMVLGYLLRRVGWIDGEFADKMNQFVFRLPLPVLVFSDLAPVDFQELLNIRFILFCFAATFLSIGAVILLSFLWHDRSIQGEFIQVSYRSSAALLGIAFIQNIYEDSGMAPLMIIGSVPLYNIIAVVALSVFHPQNSHLDRAVLKKTLRGIVTNPIILGIVSGLAWSALRLPIPPVMEKLMNNIGGMASPLGLIAMGASFDLRRAFAKLKPALAAAFLKLIGFCAVFLPIAVWLGFRQQELVAILVMLGSATTVSCFVMAKNMGHDGALTSSTVMLTTLFSAFTLTGWLYVLRSLGLI